MLNNLIIVSNRLPISVIKLNNKLAFYPSIGGLATGLAGYAKNKKNKWIGWPGIASDKLTEQEKNTITKKLLEHNCYPVFLTQKQLDGFYNGYSNSILWPLFHSIPITSNAKRKMKSYWGMYKSVNAIYAEAVINLCDHGSNIWVNDYQLLLLPALLRKKHLNDKIGFFLHIPFPNPKLFTSLINANELILGVLGADLIGMHTESYAKNIINTCQDLNIGLLTEDCIAIHDRIIRITNFPMGIDYTKFAKIANSKSLEKDMVSMRTKYLDKKMILTVDRLDPTKGLIERAIAYRDYLRYNSKMHEKVILVMLVVPSRTEIEEYIILHKQLSQVVSAVNKEFQTPTWKPIEYMYTCLPLEKLIMLYQRADIAFIVPLMDGMNLVAKEYIASKLDNDGVLILSKTAGAAEELHDALIVDPLERKTSVRALETAIAMPKPEIKKRLRNMQKYISTYTVQVWANNFLNSLFKSPAVPAVNTKKLSQNWQAELVAEYSTAIKRTILLDYDGTLTAFVDKPELAKPSNKLLGQLTKLTSYKQNHVVIISGRDKTNLGEWFNNIPLTLVVEHGSFVRKAGKNKWHTTNASDTSWKPMISNIFEQFVAKVPGSFIEQKQNSLVWHYRTSKPYYINRYLPSLKSLLQPLAQKLNLKIEQGSMIIEARPAGVSKGTPALEYSQKADFVMAIGDDTTDEEMFLALPPSAWTIKVGLGKTAARYRVKDVSEVSQLLDKLI